MIGYNFGCIIASDTLFDFPGCVFGVKLSDEDMAEFEFLREAAMATFVCSGCKFLLSCIPQNEMVVLAGDMNGHVGSNSVG